MLPQLMGIAVTRHDVAQDPQARHAGDVADDEGNWRFIWTKAFCIRRMCVLALSTSEARCRR